MFSRFLSKNSLRISAAVASLFLSVIGFAQATPQLTGVIINANDRIELPRTIPAPLRSATDVGRAASDLPMKDMFLVLQPSAAQKRALEAFLADVQNPTSPKYHQWLTPAQFGQAFAPAEADLDTVTQWLSSQGFTVQQVANSHAWIRFSGTAASVENTFSTEIHSYQLDGKTIYSNSKEMTLPRALSSVVSSVLSLNNYEKRTLHTPVRSVHRDSNGKMIVTTATQGAKTKSSNVASNPDFTQPGTAPEQNLLAPGDYSKIYDSASLLSNGNDGSGVSIALVGRSDISLSDVEAFRTIFALPFNDPTIIHANDDPGVVAGDDEEAILDVEWSGAVAPRAQIQYVIGSTTTTTDGVDISAAYIVDNRLAPIMSVSFGQCEQAMAPSEQQFFFNIWQQAAAEGISVLIASGDSSASSCANPDAASYTTDGLGVSGLASTPYTTTVGGTEFAGDFTPTTFWNDTNAIDLSSAKGYIPEAVWNESCNTSAPISIFNCYWTTGYALIAGGGGGASNCSTHGSTPSPTTGLYSCLSGYPKPSWQNGAGVPSDGVRDIPDVAMAAASAHDAFFLCYDGSCQWTTAPDGTITLDSASLIGGTSAASPDMAGVMALVEQKNGQYQGLLNPKLYALSAAQTGSCDSTAQTDPTQKNSCVFHDVTLGSNSVTCTGTAPGCTGAVPGTTFYKQLSGWTAGPGYDLGTGLGSVDIANLVSSWSNTKQTATATSLTLSNTTFTHGTAVNVSVTATPGSGSGTPTGSVVLVATGNTSDQGPVLSSELTGGKYGASVNSLPGGTYQLTAQYGGDASFASSTSVPVSVTVTSEPATMTASIVSPSSIAITSTPLDSLYYIVIQVAGASNGGTPSGTVTVTQGPNKAPVGTYPISHDGTVDVPCGPTTACDYVPGSYIFNLTYSGDSSFQTTTTTAAVSVVKGITNWKVSNSEVVVNLGSSVLSTVTFAADPAVPPTGTVTLTRSDTGATLATGSIGSNGQALISFTPTAPTGFLVYEVKALWSGDANYNSGVGSPSPLLIISGKGGTTPTTSSMTATSTTSTLGGFTSYTITVAGPSGSKTVPTGAVTLYSNTGTQLANPVPIVNGTVTLSLSSYHAGSQQIVASYTGDTTYLGSSSNSLPITTSKGTPAVSINASTPYVTAGGKASITAVISSPLVPSYALPPTGAVQFYDSVNGAAAAMIGSTALTIGNSTTFLATIAPALTAGTHSFTAMYSGDTNWNGTASAGTATVTTSSPDFAISGPNAMTVTAGQSVSIALSTSSILGYAVPISIGCTGTLPQGFSCGTATAAPGSAATLTLKTTAPGLLTASAQDHRIPWKLPTSIAMASVLLCVLPRRRRFATLVSALFLAAVASLAASGCSGGSGMVNSSVTLSSSNTKVASGNSVMLSAVVASSKSATGSVMFYDAGTSIGTGNLSNGVASMTTSQLTVGSHTITAIYSGDNQNDSAKSTDELEQTVTGTTTIAIAATSGSITHTVPMQVTLQ